MADLLFAFALSAYLRASEDALQSAATQFFVPPLSTRPLFDERPATSIPPASWADDLVRMLDGGDVPDLVSRVRTAIKITTEQASAAGMRFSFEPGKTAVLIAKRDTDRDRSNVARTFA